MELYRQCEYYIVLDDDKYDQKKCCEREGKIIKGKMVNGLLKAQHLWFVSPENGKHCSLYNDDNDFATRIRMGNGEKIAETIIKKINSQKYNK